MLLLISSCFFMGPGGLLKIYPFNEPGELLMSKTDSFVENNPNIFRYYGKYGYDKGEWRRYKMLCDGDTDTLVVVIRIFSNFTSYPDSMPRMGVADFYYKGELIHTNMKRKEIKEKKSITDSCKACFEKVFLNPLREQYNLDLIKLDE
jgi:hypothetical protein